MYIFEVREKNSGFKGIAHVLGTKKGKDMLEVENFQAGHAP
jgi:hypothetical protein